MKQLVTISIICFSLFSCFEKKKTESISTKVETDTIVESIKEESEKISEEETSNFLCSEELKGIWGNFSYLEKLKETNSVTLANEYINSTPGIDLKIAKKDAVMDHTDFMEPQYLCPNRYELEKVSDDSLYLLNKESNEKTLFQKISDLPPNTESVWSFTNSDYSVIKMMKWEWFSGEYKYIDVVNNTERMVHFSRDGLFIDGNKKMQYSLNSYIADSPSSPAQEILALDEEDNDNYNIYLMEYKEGVYNCYGTEGFDNIEEPLVKTHLKYKLIKQS